VPVDFVVGSPGQYGVAGQLCAVGAANRVSAAALLAALHGWLTTASDTSHLVAITADGLALLKVRAML
jgi:hypothetical protein